MQNQHRLRKSVSPSNIITFALQKYQKKKRVKGEENLFEEIVAENFPNLGEETDIQIQEAQRTPIKIEKKKKLIHAMACCNYNQQNTVIKKKKIKSSKTKKTAAYKGKSIRPAGDFSPKLSKPEIIYFKC